MIRKSILSLACLALLAAPVLAQGPGGPGMPPHGMGGGMHEGKSSMGPGGMWWKKPEIIKALALTADQQKKMTDIFDESRIKLIDLHANVQKAEVPMQELLAANPPDTSKVLAQIDKLASARAELEKADARMLLGIRGVLTPDQWTKLQAEEHTHRSTHGKPGMAGGPRPGGMQGGQPGQSGPGGWQRGQGRPQGGPQGQGMPPAPPTPPTA